MNSLKALNEIYNGLTGHCKSSYLKDQPNNELEKVLATYNRFYNQIENDLKVLQILKKKYVNLQFISYKVLGRGYSAQEVLEEYNAFNVLNDLTLEEMQLIIEWLKEE